MSMNDITNATDAIDNTTAIIAENFTIVVVDEIVNNVRPGYGWTASTEGISFYFVVFLSLLGLNLVLCNFLKDRPRLAAVLPDAGVSILLGTMASFIIRLFVSTPATMGETDRLSGSSSDDDAVGDVVNVAANQVLSFSSTTFFVALLPPIIFHSGYRLKMELFLEDFTPIISFACVGTAISTLFIALFLQILVSAGLSDFSPSFTELLTFASLISATDPVSTLNIFQSKNVDPRLFYLVFGESVLNDAVGLVLFNASSKFVGNEKSFVKVTFALLAFIIDFSIVSIGSLCLGVLSGLIAGLVFKFVDLRETWLLELSLYMLVMYVPFFVAEVLHLSGIVTILFCGISARRYAEPNLTREVSRLANGYFHVFAHLAETAIFLELGLSVFGLESRGNFHPKFISWAILACLLGRAANIYPIAFLYNQWLDGKFLQAVSNNRLLTTLAASLSATENSQEDGHSNYHRGRKVEANTCHMLWYSGLRGAVAYACAKTFPDANGNQTSFCVITMVIVLTTNFLFGGTTEMALGVLNIDIGVDEEEYSKQTDGGKKAGIIRTFEERFVFPCVLRDYGGIDEAKRREYVLDGDLGEDLYLHADANGGADGDSKCVHARDKVVRSRSTGRRRGMIELKTMRHDNEESIIRSRSTCICVPDEDGRRITVSGGSLASGCRTK
jgi:sodium/hydrogen exchanger 8